MNTISIENISDPNFDQAKYEKKLQDSRSAVVGTLTGLAIVTIVMVAVGHGAWWSIIPILAVGYGFIDQVVEYRLRKRYASKKEIDAIKAPMGAWFGFILVSFIMTSIFGSFFYWIALIVEVAVFSGGVYTTMDYVNAKKRNFQKRGEQTESADTGSYQEQLSPEPNIVKSNVHELFCATCGNSISSSSEYCPSCGDHI
ncbi:hypothetical protein DSAG12_00563 [Promethearchaeum syntrophicum]|uniref:Zinc-ribbon domain-containing protein n=1 Tax=Promethearchaeum syntrophicum TaxID=2594042 RepID=A0A5B9D6H8_9ARCH|nr:zinc ribbon domain-containing protein [Candidatus Prometheoarchaeum syntrophicum]QEE14748.1 hypothetical protein DSAG12_00563 [Candidatus Prometheoarchaeum syntrophicum]